MRSHPPIAGFTLVELLVVVSVIALLLGILLPALSEAREIARQTRTMSDLRQVLIGYTMYAHHHGNHLLPGYPPPVLAGSPVEAAGPDGKVVRGLVAQRYPWRLAPYVQDGWRILHGHKFDDGEPLDAYALSVDPAFGLNSIFVGGDDHFAGFDDDRPDRDGPAVFRVGRIRRPAALIAFAETQAANSRYGDDGANGLYRVTPPHALGERWRADGGSFTLTTQVLTGLPRGRDGERTVVGFADSHVEARSPEQLDDMRLWANDADGPDYDFP